MRVRRLAVTASLAAVALGGAACGGGSSSSPGGSSSSGGSGAGYAMTQVKALPSSPQLDAIKARGKVIVGTKFDQPLFGLKNPTSNKLEGFDTEMGRLLAKRIFGDENKVDYVETVSKNRESFLTNGNVDVVIATYTINDARKMLVGFAGPYYVAGQDIMVKKSDTSIKSVTDLNGKKVSSVQGSTSEKNVRAQAPQATVLLFDTYTAAAEALKDGRVDAESTDNVILLGLVGKNPDDFKLVGSQFTKEPYGIGVKKEDTVFRGFVNDMLDESYKNGDWKKAYAKTAGTVDKSNPTPPALDRY
ncbi:MAG: glutamate ABC transporter substrate-binding protein [Actinomycetota bacterium]|nr:glutamate ABC transporter substrate-binding protein [Actinomycetota bacterium]